jgi:two-component system KDP operon response regulator KdpE
MDEDGRGVGHAAAATIGGSLLLRPSDSGGPPVRALFCERIDETCLASVRGLVEESDTIVLVFYTRGSAADEVRALEAGADDCLPLSFSVERLRARLLSLTSRRPVAALPTTWGLALDLASHQATLHDRPLHLSPQEFRLLVELWRRRGRVVPYRDLQRALYGHADAAGRPALRQLAHRLRARLGCADDLLSAVPGFGYLLSDRPRDRAAAPDGLLSPIGTPDVTASSPVAD